MMPRKRGPFSRTLPGRGEMWRCPRGLGLVAWVQATSCGTLMTAWRVQACPRLRREPPLRGCPGLLPLQQQQEGPQQPRHKAASQALLFRAGCPCPQCHGRGLRPSGGCSPPETSWLWQAAAPSSSSRGVQGSPKRIRIRAPSLGLPAQALPPLPLPPLQHQKHPLRLVPASPLQLPRPQLQAAAAGSSLPSCLHRPCWEASCRAQPLQEEPSPRYRRRPPLLLWPPCRVRPRRHPAHHGPSPSCSEARRMWGPLP